MTPHATYRRRSYDLNVKGRTWGGFEAEHAYDISEDQAARIKTLADAKKFCGDFEYITFAEVVEVRVETIFVPVITLGELGCPTT